MMELLDSYTLLDVSRTLNKTMHGESTRQRPETAYGYLINITGLLNLVFLVFHFLQNIDRPVSDISIFDL